MKSLALSLKLIRRRFTAWYYVYSVQALCLLCFTAAVFLLIRSTECASAWIPESEETFSTAQAEPMGSRERMSVRALGRGGPLLSLSDGRDIETVYNGPSDIVTALSNNLARPLSLTSADFNEDGIADLAAAYSFSSSGILSLHLGNINSTFSNSPDALARKASSYFSDSPFLPTASIFNLPTQSDFIVAGDFNADSHFDIVAGARGDNRLFLFAGDGKGGLSLSSTISLPGALTAITSADVNRADGLADLIVCVLSADGAKALIFESPVGAANAQPETLPLPDAASSIAVALIDSDYLFDIAIAAGRRLVLISGRDRKLSLDESRRAEVADPNVGISKMDYAIAYIATGHFRGDSQMDLAAIDEQGDLHLLTPSKQQSRGGKAKGNSIKRWKGELITADRWPGATGLVTARVSSLPMDNLLVIDSSNRQLHIIRKAVKGDGAASAETQAIDLDVDTEPVAVIGMRLNADALTDLVILRRGRPTPAIVLTSAVMTFSVTNTNGSGLGSFRQAIVDANANQGLDTIAFNIPGAGPYTIAPGAPALPTITDAVMIDGTTQPGFIGTPIIEIDGTASGNELAISAGNSTVQGLVITRFSGNGILLFANGNNIIRGNFIGTNVSGNAALGNGSAGIAISNAPNNTIGGTIAAARNVISGNNQNGVVIANSNARANLVMGNYIGTGSDGQLKIANSSDGVAILGGSNNVIGGTTGGARNVISGNGARGISIISNLFANSIASGNVVQGNFIGLAADGDTVRSNGASGVSIEEAGANTIGGTGMGAGNVISGNGGGGVSLANSNSLLTIDNMIQGNLIGTDASGNQGRGNTNAGVTILNSASNIVGGTAAGTGNTISGNDGKGISILFGASTGNLVQGNFIGTNSSGIAIVGNSAGGVFIQDASGNMVGGTAVGARNIISGNGGNGVALAGFTQTGNKIQNNFIGTNVNGTTALGNLGNGISINARNNLIGGTAAGEGNIISGNEMSGVGINGFIFLATGNLVQGNFIGTNSSGTALGNLIDGILIDNGAANNTIGGTTTAARNVISDNKRNGVMIDLGFGSTTGNLVQGNFIGTDPSGTSALGNTGDGVLINNDVTGNTVGGTMAGAANVISGNDNGVRIENGANSNLVQGNFIGTSATGTAIVANTGNGVIVNNGHNNTIGGAAPGAGNVISGNSIDGVKIIGNTATGNLVQGNSIGTNSSSASGLGNTQNGVAIISAPGNTIGGMATSTGNVISGNNVSGILIQGSGATGNLVQGNLIGTNASGTAALSNSSNGIKIDNAPGNTIGGTVPEARNIISGNNLYGVFMTGGSATGNLLQGNFIGAGSSTMAAIPNLASGVRIESGSSSNTIGGAGPSAGNTIAFNAFDGVDVASGTGNSIISNNIFSNMGLGIDLGADGVTPNDVGDGDTGANGLQNFPVLTSSVSLAGTTIQGGLNSTANTNFTIEFFYNTSCDTSTSGEGQGFIGTKSVTTDGTGNVSFVAVFPVMLGGSPFVTATATDPSGNTSEFSQCVQHVNTCATPPDGMVGWWPGDGNPNDIQGNNNGIMMMGATFDNMNGKVGTAFKFDGVDDFVQVPDSPSVSITGAISMDAWIKPTRVSPDIFQVIIAKYDSCAPVGATSYLLEVLDNGKLRFGVFNGNGGFYSVDTVNPVFSVTSAPPFPELPFTHVAATFVPANQSKIYVNGALVPTTPVMGYVDVPAISDNNTPLTIGRSYCANGNAPFGGLIDEVELFNRELTLDEIRSIYDFGSMGKCKPGTGVPVMAGSNVTVQSGPVIVTFFIVSPPGGTLTATSINPESAGTLPVGYALAVAPAFDITTTATVTGPITVCFNLPSVNDPALFSNLRILHKEGGVLIDRTILPPNSPAPNFANRKICARVSSLSPFIIARLVNPFDSCLQDDSSGNLLQFNSTTGEYQFTTCSGLTISGRGNLLKRDGMIILQDFRSDRIVQAHLNNATKRGDALVQIFASHRIFTIMDRNTANNSCACR